jgi:hypothetical protein
MGYSQILAAAVAQKIAGKTFVFMVAVQFFLSFV